VTGTGAGVGAGAVLVLVAGCSPFECGLCDDHSILLQVTRDHIIEQWQHPEAATFSRKLGSGYPGDPITKKWIGESSDPTFGFPSAFIPVLCSFLISMGVSASLLIGWFEFSNSAFVS
jgi:hypothetical protein